MIQLKERPKVDSVELCEWLEWSGARLLSMSIRSPYPKNPGSAWPDYAQDATVAYGYTGERLRPALPNRFEIGLMDKILLLPNLIEDITTRRIISSRMLVAPVSNRYLYSWTKIAYILHTERRRVKTLYDKGLVEIATKAPQEKIDDIRHLFPLVSTMA